MSDKLDDFMKKNAPVESGALRTLNLPPRKNWMTGLALSGVLAASLAVVMVNQHQEYQDLMEAEEALDASFEDEFPAEYQGIDEMMEDI